MSENPILWQQSATKLTLSPDEIHLWYATLDVPALQLEQLRHTLTPDEQDRASRFHFERDRTRFIAGRGILRNIISKYLELPPSQVQFSYGKRGKPFLQNSSIHFNLSHSQELAIYAIALNRKVGIDLEAIRLMPDAEAIAKTFFSQSDYLRFQSLSTEQQQLAFFNAWTRKEAYLKAVGEGLYQPPDQIEVSFLPDEPVQLLKIANNSQVAQQWSIINIIPKADYIGALVFYGQDVQLSYWQWMMGSEQ
jgi:4'-phosphopantetheinyl transferase